MNQMEIFSNQEFGSIRTFEQDGKVLFCGRILRKHLDTNVPLMPSQPTAKGSAFYRPLLTAVFSE